MLGAMITRFTYTTSLKDFNPWLRTATISTDRIIDTKRLEKARAQPAEVPVFSRELTLRSPASRPFLGYRWILTQSIQALNRLR